MCGRFDDPLDVGIPQGGRWHKDRRCPCLATGIHAIQHQHVEVRLQIQRAAEALHKEEPLDFSAGMAMVPQGPGLGIEFDEQELQKIVVG